MCFLRFVWVLFCNLSERMTKESAINVSSRRLIVGFTRLLLGTFVTMRRLRRVIRLFTKRSKAVNQFPSVKYRDLSGKAVNGNYFFSKGRVF